MVKACVGDVGACLTTSFRVSFPAGARERYSFSFVGRRERMKVSPGHMQITYQLWNEGKGKQSPRWFERLPK
jgi:cytochrome c oxidase assembly protein Cox11